MFTVVFQSSSHGTSTLSDDSFQQGVMVFVEVPALSFLSGATEPVIKPRAWSTQEMPGGMETPRPTDVSALRMQGVRGELVVRQRGFT